MKEELINRIRKHEGEVFVAHSYSYKVQNGNIVMGWNCEENCAESCGEMLYLEYLTEEELKEFLDILEA
ncbi:hypothetical protein [Petroclostridium sp. X23]|uniref:hypothetical protein n=1 Tax=Petroclostridium sp. X23 TaxID=3045146 RepID=UPI0024AD11C6|nr:hypothetical protein [Petroclostridium sp. X23]WHH59243.1 hypothetical protein QKW49_00285 [Petroclostridium sp. X23]